MRRSSEVGPQICTITGTRGTLHVVDDIYGVSSVEIRTLYSVAAA